MRALQLFPVGARMSAAALMLCCTMPASAIELVTAEEASRSQQAPPVVEAHSSAPDPLAPMIAVVDPQKIDKALKNPFRMEIDFKTQAGAQLDFSTFKAYYGAFKVDITDRLLKEATRTASGLRLSNVNVPSGSHKIVLRIKDDQNRMGERELYFKVE
ncbi:MAG: hypothetical protein RI928_543 [Pseudomonadota bacterium]|jgi:hypothetical protein